MILIPGVQLCLAHYCDVHGPTPLMVTEGLPVPCTICYDDASSANSDRPLSSVSTPSPTIHPSVAITEALKRLNVDSKRSRSSEQDGAINRTAPRRATQLSSTAAADTPPASPRHPTDPSQTGGTNARRESNYRRTYDETVTKRAGPCENCALTLPKRQESSSRGDADAGPTLRTRAPYARVYGNGVSGDASPTNSNSTISDDDEQCRRPAHRRTGTITSTTSRSSASSSSPMNGHTHYLDYTSTHEPVVPASFSLVRASCIRTLSFETLPRGTATNAANTHPSLTSPSGFVTTHSPGAAASGGPIFFGDPSAGYTTAYIFRIPDVHARGHKRVYAFLALSSHRERLAMKTFTFISNAFRELASWIQGLAEAEAERYANDSSAASSPISAGGGIYGGGGPGMGLSQPQSQPVENNNSTTGSGFLSGGMGGLSRRMGGGYGSGAVSLKARGLAELVGLPDFFIELHSRFVQLLFELGVVLSS